MDKLIVRELGTEDYEAVWQRMMAFTDARDASTPDEFWLLQHPRVFTQGQAGKAEHVLMPGDIPVVQSDRGGQVTYHGPGQLVGYPLIDIKRRNMGVRVLVTAIETAIVGLLAGSGIAAAPRADAPGVYTEDGAKIAQLGLRVRRGCSLHGLSLNVDMDLEPFARINPCGMAGLAVTDMVAQLGTPVSLESLFEPLSAQLAAQLGYAGFTGI